MPVNARPAGMRWTRHVTSGRSRRRETRHGLQAPATADWGPRRPAVPTSGDRISATMPRMVRRAPPGSLPPAMRGRSLRRRSSSRTPATPAARRGANPLGRRAASSARGQRAGQRHQQSGAAHEIEIELERSRLRSARTERRRPRPPAPPRSPTKADEKSASGHIHQAPPPPADTGGRHGGRRAAGKHDDQDSREHARWRAIDNASLAVAPCGRQSDSATDWMNGWRSTPT